MMPILMDVCVIQSDVEDDRRKVQQSEIRNTWLISGGKLLSLLRESRILAQK